MDASGCVPFSAEWGIQLPELPLNPSVELSQVGGKIWDFMHRLCFYYLYYDGLGGICQDAGGARCCADAL